VTIESLTDDVLVEVVKAVDAANGNQSEAARVLGQNRRTVNYRYNLAVKRGLTGRPPKAPSGFEVATLSETEDRNGNIRSRSTKYRHQGGGPLALPDGHKIKGVSVLTDASGETRMTWTKTTEAERTPEHIAATMEAAFQNFQPFAPAIIRSRFHDQNKLTSYICCDWHIGLFANSAETGQQDWDLKIARKSLIGTFEEVADQTPLSHKAVVLGLGDLFHFDSYKNATPASGNLMDVADRYPVVVDAGIDILTNAVEIARKRHKEVDVVILEGNHDPATTIGLRAALRMFYRNDARVNVSNSPNPYYWLRHGVNLIGATHGHNTKPDDLPLIMANMRAPDWSETVSRHFHTGHIHHDTLKERGGVRVYSHRAPIPQDAYHSAKGYLSGRSMRAFTYDRDLGARGTSEVEIL
jgi:hypothetical protein